MSATNRGSKRNKNDFYPTPNWCVERLFEALPPLHKMNWVEPAAGCGSIVRACNRIYPEINWRLIDINPQVPGIQKQDFLRVQPENWDLVITNPPYTLAQEFIEQSLKWAPIVIHLLRLNFLASNKRADWLKKHMPDVYVLPNRPSFAKKGTDATDFAWMVWGLNSGGRVQILNTTSVKERKRDKNEAYIQSLDISRSLLI